LHNIYAFRILVKSCVIAYPFRSAERKFKFLIFTSLSPQPTDEHVKNSPSFIVSRRGVIDHLPDTTPFSLRLEIRSSSVQYLSFRRGYSSGARPRFRGEGVEAIIYQACSTPGIQPRKSRMMLRRRAPPHPRLIITGTGGRKMARI